MARSVSFRLSLLGNLSAMLVLLGGAILATTYVAGQQTLRLLSRGYISRTLDDAEAAVGLFLFPVINTVKVARAWGESGLLDVSKPERMNELFAPILDSFPQIAAAFVADEQGREYLLSRRIGIGDGGVSWTMRETRREEWGQRTRWLEWSDAAPEVVESWREIDYDPRTRPWYAGAQQAAAAGDGDGIHWTAPYEFFTARAPGMTVSAQYQARDGRVRVVGFDVLVSAFSDYTTALEVGREGRAFIMTDDHAVLGLPRDPRFESRDARRVALLQTPRELGIPVIGDVADAFLAAGEPIEVSFRFESGGRAWWAETRSLELGPELVLWTAVLMPESELLGGLVELRVQIVQVTLGILALSLLRAVWLSRRYSRPIEALARQSDRIGEGDLEAGEPVASGVTEVKRLAESQERMRVAVRSLLKLERDLELARRIQLATLPERLPVFADLQLGAWSDAADETGGDVYDVIGYRRRGPNADGGAILATDDPDRALLMLADATGHGIGPALSATQVRAMLRMAVRAGLDLAQICHHLNDQLVADLRDGRFITAWLGDLDATSHTLRCFSAGQAPILRYRAEADRVEILEADAPPLGVVPDLPIEIGEPLTLAPGDLVAVISDGVFDATNPSGEDFGVDRVVELIRRLRREPATRILEALRRALREFSGDAPRADDRTALMVKRTATTARPGSPRRC